MKPARVHQAIRAKRLMACEMSRGREFPVVALGNSVRVKFDVRPRDEQSSDPASPQRTSTEAAILAVYSAATEDC
jgi:hypothetical protein